ncbi:MAG: IS200/IS605 family transposase [Muribaculaceae bacterium]|nr:IS200/IS605 family transposase [Muribaculaceae bacterium]
MSKVVAYYHIVFCTKRREKTIPLQYKKDVYRYIWKIISDNKCKLLRIDGIQNHIHILMDLHPSVALAKIMQSIKSMSSGWMVQDGRFGFFDGWGEGYFACSVSPHEKKSVIDYIMNQEVHHLGRDFDEEVKGLYWSADIEYDDRDLR